MSLLVHLPLNGNLENKGLSDITVTNYGATVDDNGKIGKCYSFNGSAYLAFSSAISLNGDHSICCWLDLSNVNSVLYFISFGGSGIRYSGSDNRFLYYISGSTLTWNYTKVNKFVHVAFVCKSNLLSLYVDGVAIGNSQSLPTRQSCIGIGKRNDGYYYKGRINDVRIYDHALSPKEVKEISKGLVLHYKLDDIYNSSTLQNKYSGNSFLGDASYYPAFVKTKLSDEVGYNYKLNYTGTGNNKWFYLRFPEFEFTPDTMHQYSVYVRCNSKENINNLDLRAARIPNDYHTGLVFINTITNTDNEWHRYEISLIIPTSHVYNGTTYESHPLIELITDNLNGNGTLYSLDIDLKFIQVVENSEKVPVIDNTLFTNKVYDCSGYGNNGTVTGSLTANSNSPRYNYSAVFNGSSFITSKDLNLKETSNFTISSWINITESQNYQPTFWLGNGKTSQGISIHGYTSNRIQGGNGTNTFDTTLSNVIILNSWTHIVITYDGTTIKRYINGNLNGTISFPYLFGNTFVRMYIGYFWGGKFKGNISDFRLYLTTLSDTDIQELYDTAAYITNGGDMCAYEFVEDETSPTIEKTGVVKVDNLYENGTEITLDEELTRFGLDYITSENFNEI